MQNIILMLFWWPSLLSSSVKVNIVSLLPQQMLICHTILVALHAVATVHECNIKFHQRCSNGSTFFRFCVLKTPLLQTLAYLPNLVPCLNHILACTRKTSCVLSVEINCLLETNFMFSRRRIQ